MDNSRNVVLRKICIVWLIFLCLWRGLVILGGTSEYGQSFIIIFLTNVNEFLFFIIYILCLANIHFKKEISSKNIKVLLLLSCILLLASTESFVTIYKDLTISNITFFDFLRNPLESLGDFEQYILFKCVVESLGPGFMLLALSINSIRKSKLSNRE